MTRSYTLYNPQQAHECLMSYAWPYIKASTLAGTQMLMTVAPQSDDRSLQQNKFYWGAVLKTISEQAVIAGQRYAADAWHELAKRQFIPRKIKKTTVAGRRKKVVTVSLGSTADLSVKRMSEYLEKVQAWAATDLNVRFTEQRWQDYRVDSETGEILT